MATIRRRLDTARARYNSTLIENRQRTVRLTLPPLERFMRRVCREIGLEPHSAFVRFVSDAEMARLNQTYRKKTGTTDVLSFPSEERSKPASLLRRVKELRGSFLGDIAISPAVARRHAQAFGRGMNQEICILILHGVLHLLGYDHDTDRGEMERVESRLRHRLRLT